MIILAAVTPNRAGQTGQPSLALSLSLVVMVQENPWSATCRPKQYSNGLAQAALVFHESRLSVRSILRS